MAKDSFTFDGDIKTLHYLIDRFSTNFTPEFTKRNISKIQLILDRILENRCESYIPIEVKQYFREQIKDDEL